MHDTRLVLDLIARHVRLLGGKSVLIATTEETEADYGDALHRAYYGKGRFHYAEFHEVAPCLEVFRHEAVLILAGSDHDFVRFCTRAIPRHAAHGQVFPVLVPRAGAGAADWQHTGISENGIYRLAGQYAQTLPSGAYCDVGAGHGRFLALAVQCLGPARRYVVIDPHGPGGTECTGPDSPRMSDDVLAHLMLSAEPASPGFKAVRIGDAGGSALPDLSPLAVVAFNDVTGHGVLTALRALGAALTEGTLLLLRRYFSASPRYGMRTPLMTWLAQTPDVSLETYREYGPFGKAFIVRRPPAGTGTGLSDQMK